MMLRMGSDPYPWTVQFVREAIETYHFDAMTNYTRSPLAPLAHPTSEHFLPILYVLGAAGNDTPRFFTESIFGGSISMRGVLFDG